MSKFILAIFAAFLIFSSPAQANPKADRMMQLAECDAVLDITGHYLDIYNNMQAREGKTLSPEFQEVIFGVEDLQENVQNEIREHVGSAGENAEKVADALLKVFSQAKATGITNLHNMHPDKVVDSIFEGYAYCESLMTE